MRLRQRVMFDRLDRMPGCGSAARSRAGIEQFIAFENGHSPETPDPYFVRCVNAKRWLEWTINEIAALYGTNEWPGWACVESDLAGDPGMVLMIQQRLGRAA